MFYVNIKILTLADNSSRYHNLPDQAGGKTATLKPKAAAVSFFDYWQQAAG